MVLVKSTVTCYVCTIIYLIIDTCLKYVCMYVCMYRMAGNFGGKIFWRIAENMSFGGIYFGGWASFSHNDIHNNKMADQTRWEFNRAVN